MVGNPRRCLQSNIITKAALLSVSYLVITLLGAGQSEAQSAQPAASPSALPAVTVDAPAQRARRSGQTNKRTATTTVRRRSRVRAAQPRPPVAPVPATGPVEAQAPASVQDARTGTLGVYANSTSVATKTNTPLINIPQSVSVVTRSFIKDQNYSNLTDVTRYTPGVAVHQGEGNRDELVIRGVDSSANFFVNGFRDDVQVFRDLYNTQSIEVLRGPSALTFGRGSGGGLLNRTLKEADGMRIYETTVQTGSFGDRRISLDAGQAINGNVNARLNAFYEGSDTFRDFGHLERWGVNPTVTFKLPDDKTTLKLSYEYYHDDRTADRGNPSQASSAVAPSSTRFNPTKPFAPEGDLTRFFGSPDLNQARDRVSTGMAVLDHDFGNGLTIKNSSIWANYDKFYQNVYPGNGALSGAVNPTDTAMNLAAYQHTTNRDNLFNQTDGTYKVSTGPLAHTLGFGTEFGRQGGVDLRNSGLFPNGTNTLVVNPFDPTYFGPITFKHQLPGAFSPGVTAADSNSKYRLYVDSAYLRDQIEITPWLQVVGGARFDHFDLSATDRNTSINRSREDNKVSPQAAVILKPWQNVSVYGAYSISYLPSAGDQFSSLTAGTVAVSPQKFKNYEAGVKWNIFPRLQYTAAVYDLERRNVPLADPNNPGFFLLSGKNRIRGFETAMNGYVTDDWQMSFGYAYTDARVTSDTSATIVKGNRIQLVPYNQFSFWNKYQFTPMWAAAVGLVYLSDSYASSDDSVKLPGFFRIDAALYFKLNDMWKAQLNVENLLDKKYWASADGNNNISPGATRTFRVSLTANF